jgi:hypothetical protein
MNGADADPVDIRLGLMIGQIALVGVTGELYFDPNLRQHHRDQNGGTVHHARTYARVTRKTAQKPESWPRASRIL